MASALLLQTVHTLALTMLTFLKTLFQKKPAATAVASSPTSVAQPRAVPTVRAAEPANPVPQVAVVRLSLLAILQKLPEDLRANIVRFPEEGPTVALPLSTIQKQLAAGSVKMSLASLYRQAPAGTFGSARVEEKRMIEVPLAEVLRHVQPQNFRRRADQRKLDLPSNAPQLFGDRNNPFAVAPCEGEPEPAQPEVHEPEVNGTNGTSTTNGTNGTERLRMSHVPEETSEEETAPPYSVPVRVKAGLAMGARPAPATPAAIPDVVVASEVEGEVSIPLALLMGGWPEPARSEAAAMAEAHLVMPASLLAPCLAKGKVAFSWAQIREWIRPHPTGQTEAREGTEIHLPLKIVAPAFLAHTRRPGPRKEFDLDESIPALFDGGEAARPVTPAPAPAPIETVAILLDVPIALEEPAPSAPERLPFRLADDAPTAFDQPAPAPQQEATPAAEPAPMHDSSTLGAPALAAQFARPDKPHWSPQEMIESTAKLPGVAGVIMALREGLPVAAKLPEHMKADTVAAFLPQIFARLNNYTQEMQLGQVEDLLLTVNGAHFQSYHMGEVYFAVLGQAGQALPWNELRLVVQELQAQNVG